MALEVDVSADPVPRMVRVASSRDRLALTLLRPATKRRRPQLRHEQRRPEEDLVSGLVPFEIEFSHETGDASLTMKWDGGDGGGFAVMSANRFQPDLGLVMTKTYQKVDGATTELWEETWTYPTDDHKARRLPEDHRRKKRPDVGP